MLRSQWRGGTWLFIAGGTGPSNKHIGTPAKRTPKVLYERTWHFIFQSTIQLTHQREYPNLVELSYIYFMG